MQSSEAAATAPSTLRGLARESVTFALGGLAYKAVALISVPIFARLLTPAQLGLLDMAVVVAGVLATIGALGVDQALARRYETDGQPAVATALAVVGGATLTVAASSLLFSEPLAAMLTGDRANQPVIVSASVYAVFVAAVTSLLNVLRVRHEALRFALFGFLTVVLEMGFALAAALIFDRSIPAMVIGWTVGSLAGALLLTLTSKVPFGRPNPGLALQMMRFGAPFVPAVLSWIVGDLIIRASIAQALGLGEVGFYGIAARLTSALGILVTGFGLAWHPYLYSQPDDLVASATMRTAARLVAVIAAAGVLLTALAPELIVLVAGRSYVDGAVAVPGLAAGVLFLSLVTVGSAVAGRMYRTQVVAVACAAGAGLQALAAGPTTAAFGLAGSALVAAAGYALAALVLLLAFPDAQRWALRRSARASAVTAVGLAGLGLQLWLGHEAVLGVRLAIGVGAAAVTIAAGFRPMSRLR